MRAIGLMQHGGPEALEVIELPDPVPAAGEVLVRVHAATVNPTDTIVRVGMPRHAEMSPPFVPGMDVAGVLEAIGPGVETDLAVGDRVMAIVVPRGSFGGYSELLALPSGSVVAAPAGTTHAEASTLPMNGLTARLTLDLLDLAPGDTLAVTGAAGCYGGYVVQLAVADGLRVIADSSADDLELVTSLGAHVVVARGGDVAGRILAEVPGGVDGLADGSVQNAQLFPAIRDGGGFATVRGFRADAPRGITMHQVWVMKYAEERTMLDRLREQVEQGALTLRVAGSFAPEEAAEAHRRLEAGGTRGRWVIEFP